MFGFDLATTMDTLNEWGKQNWGLVLVLLAASYFLSNLWRNLRGAIWHLRTRELRRAQRMAATGMPFTRASSRMPSGLGNRRMPSATTTRMAAASRDSGRQDTTGTLFDRINTFG
jgi:hypothetical protein